MIANRLPIRQTRINTLASRAQTPSVVSRSILDNMPLS